jgi:hypothetical protein
LGGEIILLLRTELALREGLAAVSKKLNKELAVRPFLLAHGRLLI